MDLSRILSAIICIGCLVAAYLFGGAVLVFRALYFLPWPMALIWFGDELGSVGGFSAIHPVNQETPGCVVRLLGWIGLIGIVAYLLAVGISANEV